jgi:hypothetical protein
MFETRSENKDLLMTTMPFRHGLSECKESNRKRIWNKRRETKKMSPKVFAQCQTDSQPCGFGA